jgi:pyruvate/2-oxoglutarate dehydrogenase complex dihydrolipoamide acyltransferase (E2) component
MSGESDEGRVSPQGVPISEIIPLAAMRKMAAEHMIKSHLATARVTVMEEMDVDGFVALRNDLAEDPEKTGGVKISYTHLFIKAIAQSLGEHRVMS